MLSTSRAGPVLAGRSRGAGSPRALLPGEARGPSKAQLGPGDTARSGNRRRSCSHVTHRSLSPWAGRSPLAAGLSAAGPSPGPRRAPGRQTTAGVRHGACSWVHTHPQPFLRATRWPASPVDAGHRQWQRRRSQRRRDFLNKKKKETHMKPPCNPLTREHNTQVGPDLN